MKNFFLKRKNPYVIAEIGTNHNGKIEDAFKLIKTAKECGCHAVKFQSWDTEMHSNLFWKNNIVGFKNDRRLSVDKAFLKKAKNYCTKIKIDFSSTPFSFKQLDELVSLKPKFIKIASMDLDNFELLDLAAKQKLPVIVSTGNSNIQEINNASKIFKRRKKKNVLFMHCVSLYPPKYNEFNLRNILTLQKKISYPIGYSDHSEGVMAPILATNMGVKFIEKHFTLNKKQNGPDHFFAADPNDMKQLVEDVSNVKIALGSFKRGINKRELVSKKRMRRSAYAVRDLKKGDTFKREHFIMQRPGIGLNLEQITKLIGKRLTKNLSKDAIIYRSNF